MRPCLENDEWLEVAPRRLDSLLVPVGIYVIDRILRLSLREAFAVRGRQLLIEALLGKPGVCEVALR